MTAAHISGPLRSVPPSCVGIIGCGAARVSAHVRGPATVVVVEGEIDIRNSDALGTAIRRLCPLATPLVLDLRPIAFIGVPGFRELLAFAGECDRAQISWYVVAGDALRPLLRVFADHGLPVVDSSGPARGSA
ncbi:STAS domain-containing protein [Mycobacterium sp. NPDC050441]|uniref:STAS domain-containing protein n=1 Tax=Mycobacterium sp. NPDC050441 TaxID=3155403 RepID=UPI0033D59C46